MALFNLFGKKRNEPKKPKPKAPVEAASEEVAVEEAARPSLVAPASPALRWFHVSEKSARGMEMNQYTFIVAPRATKTQVRDAVERAYKVDVIGVNIVRLPAKARRIGRHEGTVNARKKAIVTLKAGQSIAAAQP